ncbi:tyrosine-type recombinase/integrase [Pelagibius litoralis]|uniref:tyrosine-type recombinase/integrase n=1 Tax=Pelagibius litoralis TaxID=374515 RepID=UPI002AC35EC8|nr:tyrosine-type recombinase/integrase [Pelagibius litoralis]
MPAIPGLAALGKNVSVFPIRGLSPAGSDEAVRAYLERIAPAYAVRTRRGLASDWRLFSNWCRQERKMTLPAAPDTVCAYIDSLAPTHCPGTIRRHLASLSHLHRAFGLANPVDSPEVRLAWRALTRRREIRPARRRAPLRRGEIERLLTGLGDSLIDRRDRALLLVARDSLARRSELTRLTVADVIWQAPKGGAQVLIRRAKNDPSGEGRLAWLAPATRVALSDYLVAGRISEGTLFRRVIAGYRLGNDLRPQTIARRFKALARRAGIDAGQISAHSTRLGMTLDLVGDGQSLVAVQLAGGWRSPAMPALYARQLLPELGAVARYYASGQERSLAAP